MLGAAGIVSAAGCLGGDLGTDVDGGESDGINWQSATLQDTRSGEEFQVVELAGPTLVHTFASHCLACARQQAEFVTLWERRNDLEIVELSVDPNDRPEDIAVHAGRAGVEWRVGVAPGPVTGSLVEEFGQAVVVSAQSPIIIVCPDRTTDTVSKVAGVDELERAIEDTC